MEGKKTVLVVGGGGRCHAIVDALLRSPQVGTVYCAPGNAGMANSVAIKDTDVAGLKKFAQDNGVDLTVVGPEAALAAGIVDEFRAAGLRIFGHTKAAARVETSKEFAKEVMMKYGVPTADYRSFNDYQAALEYVKSRPLPAVLKYDGLAAGKGVVVAATLEEADEALKDMLLDTRFGIGKVVVEDFLTGPEFSFMCFVDGEKVYPMPLAQDHKRAYDGDEGPNTGGMGAYTSLPFVPEEDRAWAYENILCRMASAMVSEGCPLSGVLYGGLMKTPDGVKVIEFNARFGDPETEVVLPLLESDIYEVFASVAEGRKADMHLGWRDAVTCGVVLASRGYPGTYKAGVPVDLSKVGSDVRVYHMGTKRAEDGALVTGGGRVLMVVGEGATLNEARCAAYSAAARVKCGNLFYRKDIAYQALVPAKVIDGKAISAAVKDEVKEQVVRLENKFGRKPSLTVIIVGENPASQVYVRNKVKAAGYVGMNSQLVKLDESVSEDVLLGMIAELNAEPAVDGILVQLPLPRHIDEQKVIYAIDKSKDVDGFHILNVGELWVGGHCVKPCTPKGIVELIKSTGVSIEGKRAVVVGRSNIVGKPVAKLLLDENATVTVAHSRTPDLGSLTREADILVVAVGREKVVTGDMVKPGAVVIDVGMNRDADGKLCGDVDYPSASSVAGWITPVPGGVGPMTIAMLMENTLECYLDRV